MMWASNSSRLTCIASRYLFVSDARCSPCTRRNWSARSCTSSGDTWMPCFFAPWTASRSRTNCSTSPWNWPESFSVCMNSTRSIASPSIFTTAVISSAPSQWGEWGLGVTGGSGGSTADLPERVQREIDQPALAHHDLRAGRHAVAQGVAGVRDEVVVALQRDASLVDRLLALRRDLRGGRDVFQRAVDEAIAL